MHFLHFKDIESGYESFEQLGLHSVPVRKNWFVGFTTQETKFVLEVHLSQGAAQFLHVPLSWYWLAKHCKEHLF